MSYLHFAPYQPEKPRVTKIWLVFNKTAPSGGHHLASIQWYAPWRKYTAQFDGQSVFDPTCLREIADFCETQTKEHKAR